MTPEELAQYNAAMAGAQQAANTAAATSNNPLAQAAFAANNAAAASSAATSQNAQIQAAIQKANSLVRLSPEERALLQQAVGNEVPGANLAYQKYIAAEAGPAGVAQTVGAVQTVPGGAYDISFPNADGSPSQAKYYEVNGVQIPMKAVEAYDPNKLWTMSADEAYSYLARANPALLAQLAGAPVGSASFDYDIKGQSMLPPNATIQDAIKARITNYQLYRGDTNAGAWQGPGITSPSPDNGIGVMDLMAPGLTELVQGDVPGAVAANVVPGGNSGSSGGLASGYYLPGQEPAAPALLPNDPQNPVNWGLGDVSTGALATGPGTLDRNDFLVQRVNQPWVTDSAAAAPATLMAAGQNFQNRAAPVVTAGSPEMAAQFGQSLGQQQGLVGQVGTAAGQQVALGNEMAGDRSIFRDAALGKAPSLAELQMQAGINQAQRGALSMAATSREPGGWYRAQRQRGTLANQAALQGAMLRAQEMAQARQGLAGWYGTEAQARAAATQGQSAAYQAAQGVSQTELARLQQEQAAQTTNAQSTLQGRSLDDAARINLIQQANQAEQVRQAGLNAAANENRNVAAGTQAYQSTAGQLGLGKYSADIQAQTARSLAAAQQAGLEKAALWSAAGTAGSTALQMAGK